MSQHDNRPEGAPDVNDPFLLAVRYGDADVGELGLDAAIEKQGLSREVLEYVGEQRAVRLVLAQAGKLEGAVHGQPADLSEMERHLVGAMTPLFMDALLAGWRARGIVDAEERNGT